MAWAMAVSSSLRRQPGRCREHRQPATILRPSISLRVRLAVASKKKRPVWPPGRFESLCLEEPRRPPSSTVIVCCTASYTRDILADRRVGRAVECHQQEVTDAIILRSNDQADSRAPGPSYPPGARVRIRPHASCPARDSADEGICTRWYDQSRANDGSGNLIPCRHV